MLSNRKKIPLDKTNVPVNTTTAATIKSKKSTKSKVQEKPIVKAPVKKVVTAKTTQKKKGKRDVRGRNGTWSFSPPCF